MMLIAAVLDEHVDSKIWFLDTGYSNYMNGRRVWLEDFEEPKKIKVRLVNNSSLKAEGIGNIVIQMHNGEKVMIKNVFYIPGMKCNMLSVGQLVKKGS